MKFFCILLATLCATTSFGQTIKTLGFSTTNGQVVANTGTNPLTFTNGSVSFQRLGEADVIEIAQGRKILYSSAEVINLEEMRIIPFSVVDNITSPANSLTISPVVATTRTNLGLGLHALTNDSNVTMMRALAGQTNTNTPASGTYQLTNIVSISISNGIIVEVEGP